MFRLNDLIIPFVLALAARVIWAALHPSSPVTIRRVILDTLFMTYSVALMQVVLGSMRLGGLGADFSPSAHVNLVPSRTLAEVADPALAGTALGHAVGNVLLFIPLGVLLPLVAARFRTFRSVLVAGSLLSLGIEVVQLALLLGRLMERSADVDDVILNTIGAVLGYAIWALMFGRREAEEARSAIESDI